MSLLKEVDKKDNSVTTIKQLRLQMRIQKRQFSGGARTMLRVRKEVTSSGRLFHMVGPATGKVRSLIVDRQFLVWINHCDAAKRKLAWPADASQEPVK